MERVTRPRTTGNTAKAKALSELGEDKAIVETHTTKTYVEDIPKNETHDNQFSETTIPTQENNYLSDFSPVLPLSETSLQRFIRELKEVQDSLGRELVFTAIITRKQDRMNDRFNIPCTSDTQLPPLDFTVNQVLNFVPVLQKANDNSGGRFSIDVYSEDLQDFTGIRLFLIVPNGKEEILNPNNANQDLLSVVKALVENSQQQTNRILEAIQRNQQKPEKSTLEQAIEQKILRDLLDDKPKEDSTGKLQETFLSIMAMPAMVNKMADKMFPETPAPAEQSTFEKLLSNETFMSQAMEKLSNIGTGFINYMALSKMQNQQQPPQPVQQPAPQPVPNPQQLTEQQQQQQEKLNAMQIELFTQIINELESDRVIDANNPVLQELSGKYPDVYPMIVQTCKAMPYENVFDILVNQLLPSEITDKFFDANGDMNEQGLKLDKRLQELYNFWKSL